ncbi:uncharacterized protein NP_2996A [Natronomonas pharaonis DSM 2160]|uniref:TFIIB-type zinc ribbon-containing protein n=1 Tax=Natronomonas pharaonis (strain ATCC 35678 / DSM 2160 / CIP 103997 / JCM 8858 / NBRC 14720 / NCIMB 2260 / Gabara) TaxID=348780 RepID=A0A1U7EWV7_NATPD|nr:hypothetical protein [Natronomonas pharaonis]CAI49589.1 uncharacterized protein NP_2996A [Natronomonas pharaonis DSM 2160]
MKVRGRRECKACGTRWSYYDTGDTACPSCGSLHSVGTDDERKLHTATAATLDLTPVREAVDDVPLRRLATRAIERTREFTRGYGFIDGGSLQPLDETYLAAMELRYVAGELERRFDPTDEETLYLTTLFKADKGVRPDVGDVPSELRAMRGLAYADAVDAYRSDLKAYLDDQPDPVVGGHVERLADRVRRIQALDGDVPSRQAESLVAVARDIGRYIADGDENALARADERLDTDPTRAEEF